ncbi:hypothetical protein B0H14DRAFT_2593753 [Mycena olivaceomarginata]|nr:hypothetical protein B0H14DRAFT_2593753 [Mycena olivaceomarginata]
MRIARRMCAEFAPFGTGFYAKGAISAPQVKRMGIPPALPAHFSGYIAVQSEVGECRQQPNIREYLCDADEAKYVEMRSVTEWVCQIDGAELGQFFQIHSQPLDPHFCDERKELRAREVVVSNTVEAASMTRTEPGGTPLEPESECWGKKTLQFKKDGSIPNRTGVLHTDIVTARQSRRGPSAIDPISGYRGRCLGGIASAVEPLVGSNVSEKDSETSDAWGLELGHSGQFGTVEDNLSQRFVAPKMRSSSRPAGTLWLQNFTRFVGAVDGTWHIVYSPQVIRLQKRKGYC